MPQPNEKLSPEAMKKKITIGVLAVIALVIIWQVVGLFGGSKSTPAPTAMKAAGNMPSAKPGSAPVSTASKPAEQVAASVTPAAPASAGGSLAADQTLQAPREVMIQTNAELVKLQKETETKYLAAMNELQVLKVQREIAEANQAISEAKLKTVRSEKSITSMLTIRQAPVEEGTYANMLGGGSSGIKQAPPQQQVSSMPTVDYVVLSVSQQDNKWNAVLGHSGNLYSVTVGDTLIADGSTVDAISKDGVVLQKDGMKKKVHISSALQ